MWFRRILHPASGENPTIPDPLKPGLGSTVALEPGVYRQLDKLRIKGSRELRGERIGARASHQRRTSSEFVEHRRYVPGDDIRFVDWRASARHEGVFIRQGEQNKDVIVYLLIDCSASMGWGEPPKAKLQKSLASIFGYLALAQGDRLYVHPYGGNANSNFGPVSGKGQFNEFIRYLGKLNFGGETSLIEGLQGLKKNISRGGILLILSDLLERGNLSEVLATVPAPLWWVDVIHLLHPQEINPGLRGAYQLVDSETRSRGNFDITSGVIEQYHQRIEEWQKRLELACIESHASYTGFDTDSSIDKVVIPQLRSLNILVDQ